MFPYDKRIEAVELLIKYDLQYTKVIQELGYPSINGLRKWYKEYQVVNTAPKEPCLR